MTLRKKTGVSGQVVRPEYVFDLCVHTTHHMSTQMLNKGIFKISLKLGCLQDIFVLQRRLEVVGVVNRQTWPKLLANLANI